MRGASRHSLLEGPSFDREGRLYLVDVAFGRVFRVSTEGMFTVVAEYDGQPNGLKINADGQIYIADHKNGLVLLDPDSGRVSTVLGESHDGPFKGLNDLFFASNGDLYFTDQGQSGQQDRSGRVFRWRASGHLHLVMDGIPSPNGIVMNRDETCLYVCVTRDNAVWRLPLLSNGDVSKVGAFIRMSGGIGPDGLASDIADGLAVAHIGLGAVWIFNARGEPTLRIDMPEGLSPTNVAFGGADGRTLYITEADSGSIVTARVSAPGRPMHGGPTRFTDTESAT
ncbi:SMP-30/gluconolactonase/LRE family protein [Ancylobacter aquaticus]|uniref:SMP-30/gluconolactonase/LRE family protein n=1 Tax=Ancylobacter aquaticus TaxID=100 RepID=UPI00315DE75A